MRIAIYYDSLKCQDSNALVKAKVKLFITERVPELRFDYHSGPKLQKEADKLGVQFGVGGNVLAQRGLERHPVITDNHEVGVCPLLEQHLKKSQSIWDVIRGHDVKW